MRATLTALAVLSAFPAWGQECHEFDALDAALRDQYAETAIILAMTQTGAAFLFYGNPETETWTIVALAQGCAAVVAEGIGYEAVPTFPGEPS